MTALSAPTFTHMDALVTFATGVLLPSSDVVSDIGLSIKLLNMTCYERFDNCNKNTGIPRFMRTSNSALSISAQKQIVTTPRIARIINSISAHVSLLFIEIFC